MSRKTRTFPYGSVNLNFQFDYGYDNLGRLVSETFPDKTRAAYSFDGALPTELSLAEATGAFTPLVDQLGFHASGELTGIRFRTSVATQVTGAYTFDPASYRPATASTTAASGAAQSISYAFDLAGNLLLANDTQGVNQTFTYDPHHRLAQAASTGAVGSYGTIAYGYDPAGNIRSIGSKTLRYECSAAGPSAVTRVTQANGWTVRVYDYDRDGDATIFGSPFSPSVLTRNDEGQIAAFTTGAQTSWYAYDKAGQRATKSHANASGAAIIDRFYVDRDYEVDLTSGYHERHFFVKGRRAATIRSSGIGYSLNSGGTLASETRRFYHPDQVGTNAVVTDGAGAVVQRTFMTPFGARVAMVNGAGSAIADSATTARHLYTDHEYDPESALTYMGARYYDPAVGRFLERDPVLLGAGPTEPQSINAYAYSLNRPTVVSDPTGRTPIGWCSGRGCLNLPSTSITLSTQRDKRREQKSKLADMVAWLNGEMQHMGEGMLVAEMANTDAQVAFQREYPVTAGIMAGVSLAPLVALGIAEAAPAAFGWALANPGTIAAGGTVAEGLAYAAAGVPGPAAPVASIERSIAGRWARGTFATAADSIAYHFAKHGGARTLGQYTDDGARFFAENRGLAQWGKWNPRWEESFRLKLGEQGGYFTADGRILSYWDDVK